MEGAIREIYAEMLQLQQREQARKHTAAGRAARRGPACARQVRALRSGLSPPPPPPAPPPQTPRPNPQQEMRDINEETNSRVAWFSIFSLLVTVVASMVQLAYLKKFFQRKKLL